MLYRYISFIILSLSSLASLALPKISSGEALDSLDIYLERQGYYDNMVRRRLQMKVDSVQMLQMSQRYPLRVSIVSDYLHINVDSALNHIDIALDEAKKVGDTLSFHRFEMMRLLTYPIKGMLHTSLDALRNIDKDRIPTELRADFYRWAAQIYDYARDSYSTLEGRKQFERLSHQMADSMLIYTPKGQFLHQYYKASNLLSGSEGVEAVAELTSMLDRLDRTDLMFARIAAEIAAFHEQRDNADRAIYFYALSAISDVVTGNTETTSLHRLGTLLYKNNDLDHAVIYPTISLNRSVQNGVRIRALEVSESLPLVMAAAKKRDINRQRNTVLVIVVICLSLIALAVTVIILSVQRKNMSRMRLLLSKRHHAQDEYIRELLSLYATYLQSMSDMNKLTARKLKAKQYQDLLEMIESGRLTRWQLQSFYEVFDHAIINSYPNFISGVNKLLLPDKRFIAGEFRDGLNTELRLLAFLLLGVNDSQEVSKFLGISVNSVYTYRNKLKSRAMVRDTFEEDIRKIAEII